MKGQQLSPQVVLPLGPTIDKAVMWYLHCVFVLMRDTADVTVLFEDMFEGDLPEDLEDLDVRKHYPEGSSGSEQIVLSRLPEIEHERFRPLLDMLNKNNATGCLKQAPYAPHSFVSLIRRLHDMRPKDYTTWRREILADYADVIEVLINFYVEHPERDTPEARRAYLAWLKEFDPDIKYNEEALNPFTLAGYGYGMWLMKEFPKVEIAEELRWWKEQRFDKVRVAKQKAEENLRERRLRYWRIQDLRVTYMDVTSGFDTRAAWKVFKTTDIIVAHNKIGHSETTAILTRSGMDLVEFVGHLHKALAAREPESWHLETRVNADGGPTPRLFNGSQARLGQSPRSKIARNRDLLKNIFWEVARAHPPKLREERRPKRRTDRGTRRGGRSRRHDAVNGNSNFSHRPFEGISMEGGVIKHS